MTRSPDRTPSRRVSERQAEVDLARARQELRMRALVLAVIIAIVLAGTTATIISGPSFGSALSGLAGVGLLAWIVRRLFPSQEG